MVATGIPGCSFDAVAELIRKECSDQLFPDLADLLGRRSGHRSRSAVQKVNPNNML
jgi:hypothetical protein